MVSGLRTWPDGALLDLARAVAVERLRRQLPEPVAVPVVDLVTAIAVAPQLA